MGKSILPDVPKPKVLCSSDQMTVELPSGPISGIFVKGVCVGVYSMCKVHMVEISSAELSFNMFSGGVLCCAFELGWGKGRLFFLNKGSKH